MAQRLVLSSEMVILEIVLVCRLIEKLPKVILENEESLAVSHARKLFVVIYFSGPQLVTDYLLQSPVC